jgi:peptidoglycan-associated lipoprotein
MATVLRSSLNILLASSLVISASGCSWFGKGKRDGKLGKGGLGDGTDESSLTESELEARRQERFNGNSIPTAEADGYFEDVHFDYDSANLSESARKVIESNARKMQANEGGKVQLEGHCDERGTTEYNTVLGERRAKVVKDYLSSLGIRASQLSTISYGENMPLNTGRNESAYAENRRVHFSGGASSTSRSAERPRARYSEGSSWGTDEGSMSQPSANEPEHDSQERSNWGEASDEPASNTTPTRHRSDNRY